MDVIPTPFQSLIRYEVKYQVIICRPCGAAVASKSLQRHLYEAHQMKIKDYKPLSEAISILPACETIKQYPHPSNDSFPIDDLPILVGYQCQHCNDLLTQSESIAQNHVYNKHPDIRTSIQSGYRPVALQTWSVHCWKGYWTVIDPNSQPSTAYEGSSDSAGTLTWEEQMLQMESERLQKQETELLELHARNKKDDTTPWLIRTQWPELFVGKNIKLIGATRLLNLGNMQVMRAYPVSRCKLRVLGRAFDKIMTWSLETLESTPWVIRSWLRSPQRSESDKRPFKRPLKLTSENRYIGHWKQFLYYVFRTALVDNDRRKLVYGIQFTEEQLTLITEIAGMLHDYDDSGEDDSHNEQEDYESEEEYVESSDEEEARGHPNL